MLRSFTGSRFAAICAALTLSVGLAACGSDDSNGSGKVTVFAAASLTEAFTELGKLYESENEGVEVLFSFAASPDLATQIDTGAPADVFASADEANMEKVVDAAINDGPPVRFVGNVLEIAVPKGNPGNVTGLDDFSRESLLVAVCDEEVPCGNAAMKAFAKAGVEPAIDSFEPDVKSVLTKVELGEVDAGLVYHSDGLAARDRAESIEIPASAEVVNTYPIVLVRDSPNPDGGQGFIDLVLSDTGKAEFEKWGFRVP